MALESLHIEYACHPLHLHKSTVERLVRGVLQDEGWKLGYLGIILAGHSIVRSLNRTYRGGDYETDVLSFPLEEKEGIVDGEIYVDMEMALKQHTRFAATFEMEACRYIVHGLLHLLGYNDTDMRGKQKMRELEDQYLQKYL